ncbi:MAG: protein kinase [Planctomycetaceae bacterium]
MTPIEDLLQILDENYANSASLEAARIAALEAAQKANLPEPQQLQIMEFADCLELLERDRRWRNSSSHNDGAVDTQDASETTTASRQIGRFEVLQLLGKGGFGLVFLASDPLLSRRVAIKIPRPEILCSERLRRRFLEESRLAARLVHSRLVPIFEAGATGPVTYQVIQYCSGGTLAALLETIKLRNDAGKTPGVIPVSSSVTLLQRITDGVQYLHEMGLIHQDLKPRNILFRPLSEEYFDKPAATAPLHSLCDCFDPLISDFGLARLLDSVTTNDQATNETGPGHGQKTPIAGTPGYMAPEQQLGQDELLGPHTDIWALGAILYECLTGQAPFKSAPVYAPIRSLQPGVSEDLEAICRKCLQPDPRNRYLSARALALDLELLQKGQQVSARQYPLHEQFRRWAERNPVRATVSGTVALVLVLMLLSLLWQAGALKKSNRTLSSLVEQLSEQKTIAETAEGLARRNASLAEFSAMNAEKLRQRADKMATAARQREYSTAMLLAYKEMLKGNMANCTAILREFLRSPSDHRAVFPESDDECAGFEWKYLWKKSYPFIMINAHEGAVVQTRAQDKLPLCWSVGEDGRAVQWSLLTGIQLKEHPMLERGWLQLAEFSRNDRLLAIAIPEPGSVDVSLFDLDRSKAVFHSRKNRLDPRTAALSPNGKSAVLGGIPTSDLHSGVFLIDFTNDQGREILLEPKTIDPRLQRIGGVAAAFSPDSELLALGYVECDSGPATHSGFLIMKTDSLLSAAETQSPIPRDHFLFTGEASSCGHVRFSPDGSKVAVARSSPVRVEIYSVRDRALIAQSPQLDDVVDSITFIDNDQLIFSTNSRQKTDLHQLSPNQVSGLYRFHIATAELTREAFDPAGLTLTSISPVSQKGELLVGDISGRLRLHSEEGSSTEFSINAHPGTEAWSISFVDQGKRLCSSGDDHSVRLWDTESLSLIAEANDHSALVSSIAIAPDESFIATAGYDSRVVLRDTQTLAPVRVLEHPASLIRCLAISPNGDYVVAGCRDGEVFVWETRTGREVANWKAKDTVRGVCFESDSLIVFGDNSGTIRRWNHLLSDIQEWHGHQEIHTITELTDSWLFCEGRGGIRRLNRDLSAVVTMATLPGIDIRTSAVSPDQRTVAIAGDDRSVHLYNLQTNQELWSFENLSASVNQVTFSKDGLKLAAALHDGTLQIWDASDWSGQE